MLKWNTLLFMIINFTGQLKKLQLKEVKIVGVVNNKGLYNLSHS